LKIKPEFEKEMLLKIQEDLDSCLSLMQNIDLSLTLSNFSEIESLNITKEFHELYKVFDIVNKTIKREYN
jgi:hypothetical protein